MTNAEQILYRQGRRHPLRSNSHPGSGRTSSKPSAEARHKVTRPIDLHDLVAARPSSCRSEPQRNRDGLSQTCYLAAEASSRDAYTQHDATLHPHTHFFSFSGDRQPAAASQEKKCEDLSASMCMSGRQFRETEGSSCVIVVAVAVLLLVCVSDMRVCVCFADWHAADASPERTESGAVPCARGHIEALDGPGPKPDRGQFSGLCALVVTAKVR